MQPARGIDYKSLRIVLEKATHGSPVKRLQALKKLDKAWSRGELYLVPSEPLNAKWARCQARFYLGDYSSWGGWEFQSDYHASLWYWKESNPFPIPRWDGKRVKKLWIIGDQGIGDEVFFASCIPDVQRLVDEVVIECDPRLQGIFERSFGCETVPAHIDLEKHTRKIKNPPKDADAWWPIGDLPRNFRRDLRHFPGVPYLRADREQIERFREYLGKTGVSWRGAQGSEPRIIGTGAVSLQYDREWDEQAPDGPEGLDLRNDIEGVLGLLSNLDRVVSVSTSVAHFAGALGIPTDVIIADPMTALPDRRSVFPWKWICRKTPGRTPWYGSVRVWDNWKQYQSSATAKAR